MAYEELDITVWLTDSDKTDIIENINSLKNAKIWLNQVFSDDYSKVFVHHQWQHQRCYVSMTHHMWQQL